MKKLVVCVLLVGCGGDGSGGNVEIDNLGTELAIAGCGKQWDCCTDAELMEQYMGITIDGEPITTEEQCVSFAGGLLTALLIPEYKSSLAMGRIEYDGAAAADCIAAMESLTCAEYSASTGGRSSVPAGCRPFLIPKVADGGACEKSYECTSGYCFENVCTPEPTAGQPCSEECADGLYCGYDLDAGEDICQPIKADGEQCTFDDECTSEYCDGTCMTKPLTCDGR
jgi:hypothetical protein